MIVTAEDINKDIIIDMWVQGIGTKPHVRITHVPTGTIGECGESHSRQINKHSALEKLLDELNRKASE